MSLSYRYLTSDIALLEILELKDRGFDTLESLEREDFHTRVFCDTQVKTSRLLEIRENFFALLEVSTTSQLRLKPVDFDKVFTLNSLELFSDLELPDAFHNDVWSYINLRLFPDLVLWRWPNNDDERFLGGIERSCFQRLWQRAYILGPLLASKLQEDEALNIFERTEALGSNLPLSKAIAQYVVNNRNQKNENDSKKMITSKVVKVAAQNLRRAISVQVVQTMIPEQIDEIVDLVFRQTISALTA